MKIDVYRSSGISVKTAIKTGKAGNTENTVKMSLISPMKIQEP